MDKTSSEFTSEVLRVRLGSSLCEDWSCSAVRSRVRSGDGDLPSVLLPSQ